MRECIAKYFFSLLLHRFAAQRPPNFVVGETNPDGPYLLRWYVTPWRGWFQGIAKEALNAWQRVIVAVTRRCLPNLYLHKFMRDDDDRALHDHPSWAISYIGRGGYFEHTIADGGIHHRRFYGPGSLRFMRVTHTHRIELMRDADGDPIPCWTLFLFGPTIRDWGFHCPERGWVPWQEFTADGKPGEVGKGCDA
jgi:hypothetical protein